MTIDKEEYEFGMIGLGTMGRNLVLNMCDHGYSVAGLDKNSAQVESLKTEAGNQKVYATDKLNEFIIALKIPRIILLLVPAGSIVDSVINELKPFLSKADVLIDCGNSHFTDTNQRIDLLGKVGIHFMGIGISGGESGARFGPSIMPGGDKIAYKHIAVMLEAVSAKVNNEPCVLWLGPGSSGHYVKMVHNGIEYGLMQLIAETYHLLKKGAGFNNEELKDIFIQWNKGPLQSFLIEITAEILTKQDDQSKESLVDMVLDSAHQKGTGAWTSQDAMQLQVPIPTIDIAVSMRNMSGYKEERLVAENLLKGPEEKLNLDKSELVRLLEGALYFSMLSTYAQGMALLQSASVTYKYDLKLDEVASIWRGGCIIRASLLEDIKKAYVQKPDLSNLMIDSSFAEKLIKTQGDIRKIILSAVGIGIPVPAMMASLSYYEEYRSGWLPANLIQAQRDYFGAHTYERTDAKGIYHTDWNKK